MAQTASPYLYNDDDLLDPTYADETEGCVTPITIIYYMLQVVLFVVGFYMTYHSFAIRATFFSNSGAATTPPIIQGLVNAGVVTGIVVLMYALLGILSTILKSHSLATVYIVCTIVGIFVTIYAIYWIQVQLISIGTDISGIWDGLSAESKASLQDMANCCGFRGPEDRAAQPCPLNHFGGCVPAGTNSPLLDWVRGIMLLSLTSVFTLGFALCILSIFILFVHEPRKQSKKFVY